MDKYKEKILEICQPKKKYIYTQFEIFNVLVNSFSIHIYKYDYEYSINTRLYPTDRYIITEDKDLSKCFGKFVIEILDHCGEDIKNKIKEIIDERHPL